MCIPCGKTFYSFQTPSFYDTDQEDALRVSIFMTSPLGVAVGLMSI